MSKIKLQDLTPEVYYKQSRDFQFIGRLFDAVLNSVKTNSETLYNLPLNDNTDERLIDLMTTTLGFKSRHNYNVKQLTSLCSAFCYVIKNKGNITSILTAINALLNAEGISEEASYELRENNTVLALFIPQTLTDTNLLKDLLNYILPAGMSCSIVKEFKVIENANNTVNMGIDNITKYDSWTVGSTTYYGTNTGGADLDTTKSRLIQPGIDTYAGNAEAENKAGFITNSDIVKPGT